MKLKIYFLVIAFMGLVKPMAHGDYDLKTVFKTNSYLPEISADNFISGKRRPYFRWMSKTEKSGAHYPGYGNSPELHFLGMRVYDANFRFQSGKINTIDMSIYNRGDSALISEEHFEKLLKETEKKVSSWIGAEPKDGPKQRLPKNKGYVLCRVWINKDLLITMKWSLSQIKKSREDKPEFLELHFAKYDPKNDPTKWTFKKNASKKKVVANLKDNIKKTEDGGQYIDGIPMVDQGSKGYCAVAVAERILRYYGQELDQHVMAELADTAQGGGTNSNHMMEMLKKAGVKFRVKVKEHSESKNSLELARDFDKYNKFRKRKKLPLMNVAKNGQGCFEHNYLQIKQDYGTFKEFKCKKQKSDYRKFKKAIIKSVDSGIPLVWGVQLGLKEEEKLNPQAFGGHLRMIIGYNTKSNEIFYSDTWGAGHELKKMNWDDAWTITTSFSNIYPRK